MPGKSKFERGRMSVFVVRCRLYRCGGEPPHTITTLKERRMDKKSARRSSRQRATQIAAVLVAALGAIPALAVDRTAVATLRDGESMTFPRCPLGVKVAMGVEGHLSMMRIDPCRVPPPPLPRFPL